MNCVLIIVTHETLSSPISTASLIEDWIDSHRKSLTVKAWERKYIKSETCKSGMFQTEQVDMLFTTHRHRQTFLLWYANKKKTNDVPHKKKA